MYLKYVTYSFPGGSVVKNLSSSAGDTGSVPDPGGSHMLRSNAAHAPQLTESVLWSLWTLTSHDSATKALILQSPSHTAREATAWEASALQL